jgi:transposase
MQAVDDECPALDRSSLARWSPRSAAPRCFPRDATSAPGSLVPRQISTGGRTIRNKLSKQGNRYLRVLFVEGA